MDTLNKIRHEKRILYNFLKKYGSEIEFDKIKRSASRITRYTKRHILFTPINISPCDIKNIPPIYRFRCKMYDFTEELNTLDIMHNIYLEEINNEQTDESIKSSMIKSLEEQINLQKELLYQKNDAKKYNIMIDLRQYVNSNIDDVIIKIGENKLIFDNITKKQFMKQLEKINTSKNIEKIEQLIEYTKELVAVYNRTNKH